MHRVPLPLHVPRIGFRTADWFPCHGLVPVPRIGFRTATCTVHVGAIDLTLFPFPFPTTQIHTQSHT